jgi:hypothetical protein
LLISLKTLGDDRTTYAGLFQFCPPGEINSFLNFVNYTDQIKLIEQAMNCQPINAAVGGALKISDLQNNVSMIVNDVIKSYIFNNGGGCQDLVENYIDYAKDCPKTLVQKCQLYSEGLSFGLSSCKETAQLAQGAINLAETVIPGITNPEVQEALADPKNWEDALEGIFSDIAGFFL